MRVAQGPDMPNFFASDAVAAKRPSPAREGPEQGQHPDVVPRDVPPTSITRRCVGHGTYHVFGSLSSVLKLPVV